MEEPSYPPVLPPSEIHFRLDESLGSPQFLLKTTKRGDLLIKLFAREDTHYHLGVKFKGVDKGTISFFLVQTREKPKTHQTLIETMPVCMEDLRLWRAWLQANADRISPFFGDVLGAASMKTHADLRDVGEGRGKLVLDSHVVDEHFRLKRKVVIDDRFLQDSPPTPEGTPRVVLYFESGEEPDITQLAVWANPDLINALNAFRFHPLDESRLADRPPWVRDFLRALHAWVQEHYDPERGSPQYLFFDLDRIPDRSGTLLAWLLEGGLAAFKDRGIQDVIARLIRAVKEAEGGKDVDLNEILGFDFQKLIGFGSGEAEPPRRLHS
ncbi:MAG: hypothetical protein ACYTHM_13310 [Planctomycetota bacterium]|jgi:hypothetical protein